MISMKPRRYLAIEHRVCGSSLNHQLPVRRSRGGGGSASSLFVYDLDLLVDHLSGKPVNRHVYPVALLAFNNEFFEIRFSRRVPPGLRD